MKIGIESNILKHYLRNVYFITGTAYAGKSTMVRMLAERCGMLCCGENYHLGLLPDGVVTPEIQPNLRYFDTMESWQAFVNRTPEEYEAWIIGSSREAADIEIAELLRLSAGGQKIIVDTNIPLDLLHAISDESRVAVMLSPCSMSVERFFDRPDEEKQFLLSQIEAAEDPAATMANFRACIARINSPEHYAEYANSGFSPSCGRTLRRIRGRKRLRRSCAISGWNQARKFRKQCKKEGTSPLFVC